jgi:glutamyl-tRNA reductase
VTRPVDQIVAHMVHARDVPATARELFAASFRPEPRNGLLLETCHRVEFYSADSAAGGRSRGLEALPKGGAVMRGEAVVRHALSVAVGRDSVVVGEDQVLHQLRRALGAAQAGGALDPVLHRLFALALRAGRRARSWRQAPSRSLADLAVDRLQGHGIGIEGRNVLVVGSGEMGHLATRAAVLAGGSVFVSSRSVDRATALALSAGGRVEDFDPRLRAREYAGIIVALAGPWAIEHETVDALVEGAALVVDLSVPLAVPEQLAVRLRDRLTTVDDLAHHEAGANPASHRTLARLDALIDETAEEFLAWLDGRERRAAASALVERAEAEREAELAELWRRLPDLDPEARTVIEWMSRHLAERLLREPLKRLNADADGRHEQAVRELWAL